MRMDPECNKNWDALLLRLLGAQPIDWSSQLGCAETCNSNHTWFQMRKYGDQEFVSPKEHSIICCKFFSNFCLLSNQILDKAAGTTNTTAAAATATLSFCQTGLLFQWSLQVRPVTHPRFSKVPSETIVGARYFQAGFPSCRPANGVGALKSFRSQSVNQSINQPV